MIKSTTNIFHFSNKIPLSLPYPFQYTLSSNQFSFMDNRFTQIPITKTLAKPQKQHICFVLKIFQEIINGKSIRTSQPSYINNRLKKKSKNYLQVLKESNINLKISFNLNQITKLNGYYDIIPEQGVTLDQQNIEYIHNYNFLRDRQKLIVSLKPKKSTLTAQEQLKKDIVQKMANPTKEMIEQLTKVKVSKEDIIFNAIKKQISNLGKQKPVKKFEPFFVIDQICGVMKCKLQYQNQIFEDNDVCFDSKWIYNVTNLQSEDLKKYRKRTLFDFQFWNRGSIFQIKDFVQDCI